MKSAGPTSGQPPTRVNIAYSSALNKRDPKIGQFLKQVALDANVVNQWILAMEVDQTPVVQVAKDWIAKNKDIVEKQWLAGVM